MSASIQTNNIETNNESNNTIVNPWEVSGNIDYQKLIRDFGSSQIDEKLIERFEKVTGHKAHHWLRRGFFFSHRDLDLILTAHEKGEGFYLYTGRGPSSDSLHFGHLIPFLFTKWLQDVFQCPLVIQMTGDEKFLWRGLSIDEARKYTSENIKDIIAVGFDVSKTFIFSNFDYVGNMYPNILRIQKKITGSTAKSTFGFTEEANVGKWSFCAIQAAPSFSSSFPHIFSNVKGGNVRCLIPCAIDQDPYFRLTRGVAPKLGYYKPALIHSKFFPSLQGYDSKMSASVQNSAIFLCDTPGEIRKKIGSSVSGGGTTADEQRKNGADLSKDIPFAYLRFFLEDDKELNEIKENYSSGKMLTGEVKKRLSEIMIEMTQKHQKARALVTNQQIRAYTTIRKINFNPKK